MNIKMTIIKIATALACVACSLPVFPGNNGSRPKIGLALGGGGAKGAAQVGVLKAIEKSGIHIDYIAGTSIGAINGSLYSLGYTAERLDSLYNNQDWIEMFVSGGIQDTLEKATGVTDSINFDEMPIPFRCVAVDLSTQEEVILSNGSLARSLLASMAVPVAVKAVDINGRTLVDGGVLNNLPVDVVKAMGADIVIAIDLTQKKHKTRDFSLKEATGIGGILDWIVSRPDWKKYNANRAAADIYINPDLDGYSATKFSRKAVSEMIAIGEKAGNAHLKELRKLSKKIRK